MILRSTLVCFVVAGLILAAAGCGFIPFYAQGQRFKPSNVSELVRGKSTKDDVFYYFGPPLYRSRPDLNKAQWWGYSYAYLGNLGVERADLDVFFKGDVLEDYQLDVRDCRY
ncbi:MAG: hypothetical protein P8168_06525 [Deltaproteobacteria bacterium]|jgi:outer membrane protein assembly factor BamE (lipoprotein component of BamABCDE complex)